MKRANFEISDSHRVITPGVVDALRTLGSDLQNEYIQNLVAELEKSNTSLLRTPEYVKQMRAALGGDDIAKIKEIRAEAKNSGSKLSENAAWEFAPLVAAIQTVCILFLSPSSHFP